MSHLLVKPLSILNISIIYKTKVLYTAKQIKSIKNTAHISKS